MTADMLEACNALRAILREGRLSDLPDAASRVEAALSRAADWTAADAESVRHEAAGLRLQLEAAARGIRAAQARLADIRTARHAPATYDGAGRRTGMVGTTTVARRY